MPADWSSKRLVRTDRRRARGLRCGVELDIDVEAR
jgi:hypothetical protein